LEQKYGPGLGVFDHGKEVSESLLLNSWKEDSYHGRKEVESMSCIGCSLTKCLMWVLRTTEWLNTSHVTGPVSLGLPIEIVRN